MPGDPIQSSMDLLEGDSLEGFQTISHAWGLSDLNRGRENVRAIRALGVPADLMNVLFQQLSEHLARTSDPDRCLNNLERYLLASRSATARLATFERDRDILPTLLRIFSVSQYLADLLIADPESFELVRLTGGQATTREVLIDEITAELTHTNDESLAAKQLRLFHQREVLRIAYGDFVVGQPLERVAQQLSYLADAIIHGAVVFSRQKLISQRGEPKNAVGQPAPFAVLALGKLGGEELNYSSDLDLLFLCDIARQSEGPRPISASEFFERLARNVLKLLSEASSFGPLYRVDVRLRPWGTEGPLVSEAATAHRYYDHVGRTWERQAMVKARAVAGDLEFGKQFLQTLQPWIYRRYLSRADISGIHTLKRKIERLAHEAGDDERNVKTGRGGIRDIEFAIQFLQLLNGGDLKGIRTGNTLTAIAALEQAHCLTMQERSILTESYKYLRKIEHHLQIMFNLQTHTIPADGWQRDRLALQLNYRKANGEPDRERFSKELAEHQSRNRKILDHLLHDAFGQDETPAPATDLVLDPEPSPDQARQVLSEFGFRDLDRAFEHLQALANEKISFLSSRRCRHFLAAIAPNLLKEIAQTPDPDATLLSLVQVSDSLGGKRVLWELFSVNPPTLSMFVRLCACSPYLTSLLTTNPGMIDELLDALILDRLPSPRELDETARELCKRAEDLGPILQSFKNSVHLRVGVRDVLGKEDIRETHRVLAFTAESCLREVVEREYQKLAERFGEPKDVDGKPSELVILGLGKLGGQEPNYHSDLDLIFIYREDGPTQLGGVRGKHVTTTAHFYNQLAQRVIQQINLQRVGGQLYEVDARLRPSGRSGVLAVPFEQITKYFSSGTGELWERLMLIKARPVFGVERAREQAMKVVYGIICELPWNPDYKRQIREMRLKLEWNAHERNLKRGVGGTMDVEFITQMLQFQHARKFPEVLCPGTMSGLEQLAQLKLLDDTRAKQLMDGYHFLRRVESGLRLMNTTERHDLPADARELQRLAYLLGGRSAEELATQTRLMRKQIREWFEEVFAG